MDPTIPWFSHRYSPVTPALTISTDWAVVRPQIAEGPHQTVTRHLRWAVIGEGLSAAAAVFAISASISLLKPATPTAPTTSPLTRIGTPPRSAAMLAVTNAVRP
jgi:hypothetical protein